MPNFVDAMLMELMMSDPALAQAIAASRNEQLPRVAKPVKCPVCNLETPYSAAASEAHLRVEDRCSHQARTMFLSSHCVVCMEDHAGPPMVGLRCGHCVCVDDFKRLGGKMGDDAMMTPEQAAEFDAEAAAAANEEEEDGMDREQAFFQFQNMMEAFRSMGGRGGLVGAREAMIAAGVDVYDSNDEDEDYEDYDEDDDDDDEDDDEEEENFDDLPPLISADNRIVAPATRAEALTGRPAAASSTTTTNNNSNRGGSSSGRRGGSARGGTSNSRGRVQSEDEDDSDEPPPLEPRGVQDDSDDDEPPPLEPRRVQDDSSHDNDDDDDDNSDLPELIPRRQADSDSSDNDEEEEEEQQQEPVRNRNRNNRNRNTNNRRSRNNVVPADAPAAIPAAEEEKDGNDSEDSEPPPLLHRPEHSETSSDDDDDDNEENGGDSSEESTDADMPGLTLHQDISSSESEQEEVVNNSAAGRQRPRAAAGQRPRAQKPQPSSDDDDDELPPLVGRAASVEEVEDDEDDSEHDGDDDDSDDNIPPLVPRQHNINGSDDDSDDSDEPPPALARRTTSDDDDYDSDEPPPAMARRTANDDDSDSDGLPDLVPRHQNMNDSSDEDDDDDDDEKQESEDEETAAEAVRRFMRTEEEKHKAMHLSASTLKKKLQERGIDYRGMEKKDLVEAYAKSVVDAEFAAATGASARGARKNRKVKNKKKKKNNSRASTASASAAPAPRPAPAPVPPPPRPVDPFADLPALVSSKPLPKNGMWVLSPNNSNTMDLHYAVAQDGEIHSSEVGPLQQFRRSRLIPCRTGTRAYIYEPQPPGSTGSSSPLWHVKLKSALGGGSCPALQLYELSYDPSHTQLIANPSNHDVWALTKSRSSSNNNANNRKSLMYVGFRDPTNPNQVLEVSNPDARLVSADSTGLWLHASTAPQSIIGDSALLPGLWYVGSPWKTTTTILTTAETTTTAADSLARDNNKMIYCGDVGALATPAATDGAVWTLDPVRDNSSKCRLSYITIIEGGGGEQQQDDKRIVSTTLDVSFSMVQALVASNDDDGLYLHYKHMDRWKLGYACLVKTYTKELVDCPRNSTLKAAEGGCVWMWKKSGRSPDRSLSFVDISSKDGGVGVGGTTSSAVSVIDSTKKFRSGSFISEVV